MMDVQGSGICVRAPVHNDQIVSASDAIKEHTAAAAAMLLIILHTSRAECERTVFRTHCSPCILGMYKCERAACVTFVIGLAACIRHTIGFKQP
jgi:hypothetical protein